MTTKTKTQKIDAKPLKEAIDSLSSKRAEIEALSAKAKASREELGKLNGNLNPENEEDLHHAAIAQIRADAYARKIATLTQEARAYALGDVEEIADEIICAMGELIAIEHSAATEQVKTQFSEWEGIISADAVNRMRETLLAHVNRGFENCGGGNRNLFDIGNWRSENCPVQFALDNGERVLARVAELEERGFIFFKKA